MREAVPARCMLTGRSRAEFVCQLQDLRGAQKGRSVDDWLAATASPPAVDLLLLLRQDEKPRASEASPCASAVYTTTAGSLSFWAYS